MRFLFLLLYLCYFFVSCTEKHTPLKIDKGISCQLAKYREQKVSDIVYNLHFKIPNQKLQSIA